MKKYIIYLFLVVAIHAYGQPKSKNSVYYDIDLNRCEFGQIIVLKVGEVADFLIIDTKKNEVTSYWKTQFDSKGGTKPLPRDQKKLFLAAFYKLSDSQTTDLPYEQSIVVAIRGANGVKIKKYIPSTETDALYDALRDEYEREYLKRLKQEKTKTEPNQAPQTTTRTVTPAASHPSRQRVSCLI